MRKMTEGERMVWATAFAARCGAPRMTPRQAVTEATQVVLALRAASEVFRMQKEGSEEDLCCREMTPEA